MYIIHGGWEHRQLDLEKLSHIFLVLLTGLEPRVFGSLEFHTLPLEPPCHRPLEEFGVCGVCRTAATAAATPRSVCCTPRPAAPLAAAVTLTPVRWVCLSALSLGSPFFVGCVWLCVARCCDLDTCQVGLSVRSVARLTFLCGLCVVVCGPLL